MTGLPVGDDVAEGGAADVDEVGPDVALEGDAGAEAATSDEVPGVAAVEHAAASTAHAIAKAGTIGNR
jgi:hypothetical protein